VEAEHEDLLADQIALVDLAAVEEANLESRGRRRRHDRRRE